MAARRLATSDIFAEKDSLQSLWCRVRVRHALGALGARVEDNLLVVEDRRRATLSSRIPGRRWGISVVTKGGLPTEELIHFDPSDSSELPLLGEELSEEAAATVQRVARRGGKIIRAAEVAAILDNPPPIDVPNPLNLIRAS